MLDHKRNKNTVAGVGRLSFIIFLVVKQNLSLLKLK